MNIQEIISNLQCNLDLMQLDPFTGETIDKSCMNKLNRELCTALEETIKILQENNWISVKDRLPDEDGNYIVCLASGTVKTTEFLKGKYRSYFRNAKTATHWMPLPELPEMD